MNQIDFVYFKGLQIGDRLVREKGIYSKHHGIYAGIHNGQPLVAENQTGKGVQYVTLSDFLKNNTDNLKRIEQFRGSDDQRRQIIPRINKLVGTNYSLINFNCEHFAEYIQNGEAKSRQVQNAFGVGLAVLFLGLVFGSKN